MPRQAKKLTDLALRKLTKPGLYFVGEVPGLALQVLAPRAGDAIDRGRPVQGKTWILRAKINGKRRDMGLGGYPAVTLTEAYGLARAARAAIAEGIDPIEARREALRAANEARAAKPDASQETFKAVAERFLEQRSDSWRNEKHRQQWANTLKTYAYPILENLPVSDIAVHHIEDVLWPIWKAKPDTAMRLRGRIERVLASARARELIKDPLWTNPASWDGKLGAIFPAPERRNRKQPALPIDAAPAFMAGLQEREGMGARALEFLILTATRSGEVRGARWSELDLEKGLWVIPGDRMKVKGREHRVPLSKAALDLLEALPRIGASELVFPAPRGGQLSDNTLAKVIDRMNESDGGRWVNDAGEPIVPHGFRSTFRDWASERTAYTNEVAEMALAHTIKNKTEAAYRRGDLLDKRARMMSDWARFLNNPAQAKSSSIAFIGEART